MREIVLCDDGIYHETSKLCKEYNIGVNVDSYCDPEYHNSHPEDLTYHLQMYSDVTIKSMHGAFTDLCFGSRDNLIREATKIRFDHSYDISKKLGCNHIIFHHGYIPGTSYPPNWIKRSKSFWDDFLTGKDSNTIFYIENQFEHSPDMILDLVSAVDNNNLKICLDIGHAHCNSKTPVEEWIKKLSKNIGFVHLHNNHGSEDEHLGLDNGTIDILEVCNLLEKYAPDSIWAIESHFRDVENSINWLKNNGFLK